MILVSGGGGKTGRAVVAALARRGLATRAWVRRHTAIVGATDVFVGDMTASADWERALTGCDAVYHICPNMHPDEVAIGRIALAAARNAAIGRFVYHSVLHPQTRAMPHHWNKLQVEELLFESSLPFTILQPTAYVQNIRARWQTSTADGVFAMPYPVATRISLIDLRDVAEVAATVLTEAGHAGATYELVGTAPLSQTEVAAEIGRAIGRTVAAVETPLPEWERFARAGGLSEYAITTLLGMFRYYAAFGLVGNPTVAGWLLGRPPTTLGGVLARWS